MRTKIKPYFNLLCISILLCLAALFAGGCAHRRPEPATPYVPEDYLLESTLLPYEEALQDSAVNNSYDALSVPTYLTQVKEFYFIVDCYHNQVIYHDNLEDPLYEWKVMTSDLSMGHTLASDGVVYLIDYTENNRILVMERAIGADGEALFVPTQEFTGIGNRPHYIVYDTYTDTFYAWSSLSGEMYLFRRGAEDTRMYLTEIRSIPSLDGVYVRSFTIAGDEIYFVSGNSSILLADLSTFEIKKEYPVPPELAGMIQLTPIEDYYYITVSTDVTGNQDYATMIRTRDLSGLSKGEYEDIYSNFIGGGTPYYLSNIQDTWYLTEHRLPGHSIWSFQVVDNTIQDVTAIY